MDEPGDRAAIVGKGCGCQVAGVFFLALGLPVIMMFTMGLAPCQHGPCNPNGKRDLLIAAMVVLALSAGAGVAAWRFAGWWEKRQAARGRNGLRQLRVAGAAFLLVVGIAFSLLLLR